MSAIRDLNRVAVFVRVVEAESFTRAAQLLGLPKSSVSRSVSRLEDELGVRLLQRTTRKLNLTDAGRAYFARVRDAMNALDEAAVAVTDMGKEPRGVVRFTAPVDIGVAALADIVAKFVRRYPQIRVEVVLTSRKVDLVDEGFDLALRGGKLDDSTLIARKVAVGQAGLYATAAYLRKRGRPKVVSDLAAHDFVLFRARDGRATVRLAGPNGDEEVVVTGPISVDDFAFVRSAVLAGAGIGLIPAFLAATPAARGELTRILPDYSLGGAGLHLVSPSVRYEPARVVLFREFLLASFRAFNWDR